MVPGCREMKGDIAKTEKPLERIPIYIVPIIATSSTSRFIYQIAKEMLLKKEFVRKQSVFVSMFTL